jgi:predicted ester cyclase
LCAGKKTFTFAVQNNDMKKITSITLILLLMTTTSKLFGQKPAKLIINPMPTAQHSAADEATLARAVAVSQSILEGNWAKLDELLDDNFTYTGDGYVFTKDQYIGFMQDMRAAFSDFEMILTKSVVDGEFASIQFTSNVVNTGKFMGAPANKKLIHVDGIFMRNIKNGKVMQEWQTTDLLGTMTQIGGGALFFYSVFVGGFGVKTKPPVRKGDDFLYVDGKVVNYDLLPAKEKNKYVKNYMKNSK